MPRQTLCDEQEIELFLSNLPLWERDDKLINRELVFSNFVAAVGAINSIAVLAEVADHHPDVLIYGYNKLRISLSTHDKGGLTKADFELAKKIDDLKF